MIDHIKISSAKMLLFGTVLAFLSSCIGSGTKTGSDVVPEQDKVELNSLSRFEMIDEIKSETPGKAELLEYALYTDSVYTEEALKDALMDLYSRNCNKDVFDSHDRATVVGAYLFTSLKTYEDKSNWIAMLIKGPIDSEPYVSYNSFKVKALSGQSDQMKSLDEIELEKLNR